MGVGVTANAFEVAELRRGDDNTCRRMDSMLRLEGFNGFNAFLVQAKGACAEEVSQEFAQNCRGKLAALESPVERIH